MEMQLLGIDNWEAAQQGFTRESSRVHSLVWIVRSQFALDRLCLLIAELLDCDHVRARIPEHGDQLLGRSPVVADIAGHDGEFGHGASHFLEVLFICNKKSASMVNYPRSMMSMR